MSVKWDPFRDLITLQEHINRLFDANVTRHHHEEGLTGWHPPSDVCETAEEIHLYVEIPGVNPETLDLQVERDRLILRGERRRSSRPGEVYHQSEILLGNFHRTFHLPASVDADRIQARYQNGILEITIPKQSAPRPQTVPIQVK